MAVNSIEKQFLIFSKIIVSYNNINSTYVCYKDIYIPKNGDTTEHYWGKVHAHYRRCACNCSCNSQRKYNDGASGRASGWDAFTTRRRFRSASSADVPATEDSRAERSAHNGHRLPRLTWQDNNNNCFSFRSLHPPKSYYGCYTHEAFNRSTVAPMYLYAHWTAINHEDELVTCILFGSI